MSEAVSLRSNWEFTPAGSKLCRSKSDRSLGLTVEGCSVSCMGRREESLSTSAYTSTHGMPFSEV